MAIPVLPIALALAFVAFGAAGSSRRKKKQQRQAPPAPLPPSDRWLEPGDVCDPIDQSNVPPGYGCFPDQDGLFVVVETEDPMAAKAVDYKEFGDDQGVAEALQLLGFGQQQLKQRVAKFQEYAYDYFDLADGTLRLDGKVDNRTIGYLTAAVKDFEEGSWISPQQAELQEVFLQLEVENADHIVDAWQQEPLLAWELPDQTVMEAQDGQPLSAWISNIVYWGTYEVGLPDSPAPKTFSPCPSRSSGKRKPLTARRGFGSKTT